MLIHSIIDSTSVNGPGKRMGVWLQGCAGMNCDGCWNRETHAFVAQNSLNEASIMVQLWLGPALDGVTFSGGEPMQQAEDLLSLMKWIRKKHPHMSFGMYTGYSRRELDKGEFSTFKYAGPSRRLRAWKGIQELLDFAVMGRFNQAQREDSRPLCSSKNQKLVLFSDRYQLSDFRPQEVEFHITSEDVQITGFPTEKLCATLTTSKPSK